MTLVISQEILASSGSILASSGSILASGFNSMAAPTLTTPFSSRQTRTGLIIDGNTVPGQPGTGKSRHNLVINEPS